MPIETFSIISITSIDMLQLPLLAFTLHSYSLSYHSLNRGLAVGLYNAELFLCPAHVIFYGSVVVIVAVVTH